MREARLYLEEIGRGERIRTSDPLGPNQVLYQAEPLPDGVAESPRTTPQAILADKFAR